MELFTRSYDKEWNRIVDLYVSKDKGISKYIKDDSTCKIVLIEKGEVTVLRDSKKYDLKAPAFFFLSQKDRIESRGSGNLKTSTIFFKPSVIRDEFTFENLDNIDNIDVSQKIGTTIFQDFQLIYGFIYSKENFYSFEVQTAVYVKLKGLFNSIENELTLQKDGFWPCRSRSYFMELLYFLCYNYIRKEKEEIKSQNDIEFELISDYLHEHINEEVTLERITGELSVNRNKLNEIFHEKTQMTCMNYLTKMRMDLASILLVETDLRIVEICERIGYDDANYFSKAFKKEKGMVPSAYRKEKRE